MKDFGAYMRRARRTDPPNYDWSPHYVDYDEMKNRMVKDYLRRRKALRSAISQGNTTLELPHTDVQLIYQQSTMLAAKDRQRNRKSWSECGGTECGDLIDTVSNLDELEDINNFNGNNNTQTGSEYQIYDDFQADQLEDGQARTGPQHTHERPSGMSHLEFVTDLSKRNVVVERADFCSILDRENAKAVKFYQQRTKAVSESISQLMARKDSTNEKQSHEVGNELLELFAFAVVNIVAVRQILIRYDAFVRTFDDGMPLSQWYLNRRRIGQDHRNNHLLFDISLLHQMRQTFTGTALNHKSSTYNDYEYVSLFISQFDDFQRLLEKTLESVERTSGGSIIWRDRLVRDVRNYFIAGTASTNNLSLEPNILRMRGRHLKEEMQTVAKWRTQRETPDPVQTELGVNAVPSPIKQTIDTNNYEGDAKVDEPEEDGGAPPPPSSENTKKNGGIGLGESTIDPENVLPLILNLLSCYLHMVNSYVIEPSSAYYANALGVSDAIAGAMMGLAPLMALVSAIVYSFWTNYQYKTPILVAASLKFVGNIMYAMAYSYKSMPMCLLGRAIDGLGAPRVINRRYMADATPFALRTASSAAFALATAVGAATGPGLAIMLDFFEFEFRLPLLGVQYFNGMTGPGYFMACVWGMYIVVIVFLFKEPQRSGIAELKQREATAAAAAAKSSDGNDVASPLALTNSSSTATTASSAMEGNPSISFAKSMDEEDDVKSGNSNSAMCGCFRHLTSAVILCMSLIFMKRIALESIVGSTSIVTKNRYGWSIKNVGTLHLLNGMLVIPVSILSGWLSQFYQDRQLTTCFLAITLCGLLMLIDLSDLFLPSELSDTFNDGDPLAVGQIRYIVGCVIAFSGVEACESFVASMLSKAVPSALAVGTFNSGLLTTLVGTGGRAFGDFLITGLGLISLRNILNLLMIPAACLLSISLFLVRRNYSILEL